LLIFFHHLLGVLACHSDGFSKLVKGQPRVVIKEGRADQAELKRCRMSAEDLEENIRLNGNVSETGDVQEARLERNGTISVVRKGDQQASGNCLFDERASIPASSHSTIN
jgi:uncharacterized membrane protein YcaP (DUF421 family)